jgi:hypothetical protein
VDTEYVNDLLGSETGRPKDERVNSYKSYRVSKEKKEE